MEVLDTRECFRRVEEGMEFDYTKVLFHQDGIIYCAKLSQRNISSEICADELQDSTPIPREAYCPLLPPGCTIAESPGDSYIKQPDLMSFNVRLDLAGLVLLELATCELLRKYPHPNIATYYGCVTCEGRVTGLCFKKYHKSLLDEVNPGFLNKIMLMQSEDRAAARREAARYLTGIENGIKHLHAHGVVHNDLNPANIMITENGDPVIIDFDSSSAPGTALDNTKRTYGWFDPDQRLARKSNDNDALEELRIWLTGSEAEKFQF